MIVIRRAYRQFFTGAVSNHTHHGTLSVTETYARWGTRRSLIASRRASYDHSVSDALRYYTSVNSSAGRYAYLTDSGTVSHRG